MWLIVGLGNPGPQYEYTRHNIGFLTVDHLIGETGAHPQSSSTFSGELYKKGSLLLLKPLTYMNRSGLSVQAVKQFYKVDIDHIVVIHDDLDLPFGAIRFKQGGGSGGHNGLKSIDQAIGNDYLRLRMGIGKPAHRSEVIDYVLQTFTPEEMRQLPQWIDHAARAALALTREPMDKVATRYSVKKPAWAAV